MGFLGWVVLLYILTALICWSVFGHRFLCAKDIRRPRNSDLWDAFGPAVGVILLAWTLMIMNPGRTVRTAGKSVLWPVTLYRWFQRQGGATPTGSASALPEAPAPDEPPTPLGQPGGTRPEPQPDLPGSPVTAPGPESTSGRFAAKSMVGPLSLPNTPIPRATSGPWPGRHVPGPLGHATPSGGPPAPGAPVRGRQQGAPAPRSTWDGAASPMWGAPRAAGGPAQPLARPAPHRPPRHRAADEPR